MSAPQGAFYWNGVQALLNASYTLSLGVNPGVASLAIPPQPTGVAMQGTLTIRYGSTTISFPDCRVGKIDAHFESSGRKYWLLHILDGRWRWRFGIAKAWANRRLTNGYLDEEGRATPRELATMLAEASGIGKIDVSALPTNTFPYIDWEWRERPDLLLAQLCDMHGCRIAYGPGGKTRVVRNGQGLQIPKADAIEYQQMLDPAEIPSEVVFVAGRSVWNADVPLEAVGEEPTGEIRLIDDLSYKPEGGWGESDPPGFGCIEHTTLKQYAQRTVFRWYRPKVPFKVGPHEVTKLWQILPWNSYQLVPTNNFAFLSKYSKDNFSTQPPWAFGDYLKQHETYLPVFFNLAGNLIKVAKHLVISGIGVDTERGIVQFSEPMYRLNDEGWREPAKLKIRIATSYRDLKTRTFEHWTSRYPLGPKGTKPKYLIHEEIGYRQGQNLVSGNIDGASYDNEKDLQALAKYYANQIKYEYQFEAPEVATLPGFVPIATDGAIQQVRWSVDDGRPTTFVARNTEQSPPGGSWSERRFYEDTLTEIASGVRDKSIQRF